ncbi:MAG: hypothetical protein FWG85_00445 [Bacteroidetes bacterium]|nr:hypothetical protein [Bacteroidota bacterium]
MKKLLAIVFLFYLALGCSSDPNPVKVYTPSEDFYLRDDAANTLIPLISGYKWTYRIDTGTDEKPNSSIRHLLDNDVIDYVRILPVRQYDNNEGWGRYEYMALCYITTNQKAFFYMNEADKIYVGRYLQADNNGFESVVWEYELPIYSSESSARSFVLNRNVAVPNIDEDYLHEKQGYYTIDVEVGFPDFKKYTECKLFECRNKRNTPDDPIRINRFYFKQGKGLIRFQQFALSPTDSTLILLFKQDLIESN